MSAAHKQAFSSQDKVRSNASDKHKMSMFICPLSKCNYFFTLRLVINIPVRHVDLHQFEDCYCLLLQGLVSHKRERFAAKKKNQIKYEPGIQKRDIFLLWNSIADPGCLSRIRTDPGSRVKKIPDPEFGSRIRIRIKEFKYF